MKNIGVINRFLGIFSQRYLKMKLNKKAMETEILAWWIIALVILAIMITGYAILKAKGIDALEYLKNLFRFRS